MQLPTVVELGAILGAMETLERAGAFAGRLREACQDQGLPDHGAATMMAKKLRVSPQAAQKWFTGKSFPDMAKAIALADVLDVHVNWLLTGRGPKRSSSTDVDVQRLGEAVQEMPPAERRQVLDFIQFRIDRGQLFVGERQKRYMATLESLKKGPQRR